MRQLTVNLLLHAKLEKQYLQSPRGIIYCRANLRP